MMYMTIYYVIFFSISDNNAASMLHVFDLRRLLVGGCGFQMSQLEISELIGH